MAGPTRGQGASGSSLNSRSLPAVYPGVRFNSTPSALDEGKRKGLELDGGQVDCFQPAEGQHQLHSGLGLFRPLKAIHSGY